MKWGFWIFMGMIGLHVAVTGTTAAEVKITPLADDVWLHRSWRVVEPWGRVSSNGLIVREGDHVVVIDTAWGTASSRLMLEWIDRELGLPVDRLIVTHFHSDRLEGWEQFAARGARVIASARTLELAGVTPTEAFDRYTLEPGETMASGSMEILYPGPAHTEDNVVVWIPALKLLVGGCAMRSAVSRDLGNVGDASIPEWATSMRRVQRAYPDAEQVVPGHGAVGDMDLIQHTIDLAEAAQSVETR